MQGMLARCAALALTVAVAVAAFVAVAAWAHNPQQAFHDASGPRWSALMSLFGAWLTGVFFPVFFAAAVVGAVVTDRRGRSRVDPEGPPRPPLA